MRWLEPRCGDFRVRSGFLWWPKYIAGETRWLEFAAWKECRGYRSWSALRWMDEGSQR